MRKFIEKDTGTMYTIRELELMFEIATLKHEIDNDDYEDFDDWLDCMTDMSGELEEITAQYCVVCRNENDGILAVKYGGRLLDAEYIKEEMVFDFIKELEHGSYEVTLRTDNLVIIEYNQEATIFTIEEIIEED